MTRAEHPGTITVVDMATKQRTERPAEDYPELERFVFLKRGMQTDDPREADEIIPIVEIRHMPLDDNNQLVPKDRATRVQIIELGPGGRPLRYATAIVPKRTN
jgi:hypothetical protein